MSQNKKEDIALDKFIENFQLHLIRVPLRKNQDNYRKLDKKFPHEISQNRKRLKYQE